MRVADDPDAIAGPAVPVDPGALIASQRRGPRTRLREIEAAIEALEDERRGIYRASFRADAPQDVIASPLTAQILGEIDADGEPTEPLNPRIRYPITVDGISAPDEPFVLPWRPSAQWPTPWVAVRPVDARFTKDPSPACPRCEGSGTTTGRNEVPESCGCRSTWLGVLVGELPTAYGVSYCDGILHLGPSRYNPAIWIPDRSALVFGHASYWRRISSADDLRVICASDVARTWYVRAFTELFGVPDRGGR